MGSKHEEVGIDLTAGLQFHRLPVRPVDAHSGKIEQPAEKTILYQRQKCLHSQTIHVSDRTAHSNREAGMVRSPSHKAHTVASETTLARTRVFGEGHSIAPRSPSTPRLVVK